MQSLSSNPLVLDLLAALLGVSVGSFLNVLALRSLAEKSLFIPRSQCLECKAPIRIFDLIPVVSYFLLKGKCRDCHKPISWQYPFVEIFTAIAFVVVLRYFGWTIEGLAMLIFSSTLIALCVTDFREKLLPHEITYPSMLLGIFYSAAHKQDLLGTMAGIGASYIIFDFLAFYGLKFYIWLHGRDGAEEEEEKEEDDAQIDGVFDIKDDPEEDFEVMGGGDAVLAAVISAWLGWERLVVALIFGFLFGAVMGCIYLLVEMRRQRILHECIKPALLGAGLAGGFLLLAGIGWCVSAEETRSRLAEYLPQLSALAAGAGVVGALIGIIATGSKVSKPFPFGPALAGGAAVAMFYNFLPPMMNGPVVDPMTPAPLSAPSTSKSPGARSTTTANPPQRVGKDSDFDW